MPSASLHSIRKRACHPFIWLGFYLQILPDELIQSIPRSTRHYHENIQQESLFGYQWYVENQQLMDTPVPIVFLPKKSLIIVKHLFSFYGLKVAFMIVSKIYCNFVLLLQYKISCGDKSGRKEVSNQYYILKPAVGTKETGMAYPAVESYEDYDFKGQNSVYNLDSDCFPNFTPDIRYKVAKGAKLCDIMSQSSISACGLLVNEKVKEVLEQFKIIPHQFYSAIIENKEVKCQYYWMHLVWEDGIKHLDFKNSKFKIKRGSKNLGEIEIGSVHEMHKKQGELGFISMIHNYEYTFKETEHDLFIHPLNRTIFISDIVKAKLTIFSGVDLSIAQNLKVV